MMILNGSLTFSFLALLLLIDGSLRFRGYNLRRVATGRIRCGHDSLLVAH
jgi:hypothetical protein